MKNARPRVTKEISREKGDISGEHDKVLRDLSEISLKRDKSQEKNSKLPREIKEL